MNTHYIIIAQNLPGHYRREISPAEADGAPLAIIDKMLAQEKKMLTALSKLEQQAAKIVCKFSI